MERAASTCRLMHTSTIRINSDKTCHANFSQFPLAKTRNSKPWYFESSIPQSIHKYNSILYMSRTTKSSSSSYLLVKIRLFIFLLLLLLLYQHNCVAFMSSSNTNNNNEPHHHSEPELCSHSNLKATTRAIPDRVIIGYTTSDAKSQSSLEKVTRSVENGVNVLMWSFISLQVEETNSSVVRPVIRGGPDLSSLKLYRSYLKELGYGDTIHLISFGGWNGPHLNTDFSAEEMYLSWKEYGGDIFDGFDWDLEGEDNAEGPGNYFSVDVLNRMGEMSALAKKDGYIVTIAPMESYLDVGIPKFSRYVNLPYEDDWHPEFTYHGANLYAYILAKWQDAIDLISIQLYESFSHAAYSINHLGKSPSVWLVDYVIALQSNDEGFYVNFDTDDDIDLGRTFVNVPMEKLVIGKL